MTPELQQIADRDRRKSLRSKWNIPKRHEQLIGKTKPNEKWEARLSDLKAKLGTGFLVAIVGSTGSGKTMLAVELMQAATEKFSSAYYTTATEFFLNLKSCREDDTQLSLMQRLETRKLLVIEEISRRGQTDWENNLMFELINARYNGMVDTLLIDNATAIQFESSIDPAIASRMKETGGIIEADWGTFR